MVIIKKNMRKDKKRNIYTISRYYKGLFARLVYVAFSKRDAKKKIRELEREADALTEYKMLIFK